MANHHNHPIKYNIPREWGVRYSRAKALAKYRGEYWAFTHETWYDMWVESGVMHHMSNKPEGYCMVRKDPIEAWSPNNCIIVTRRNHFKKTWYEKQKNKKVDWQDRHGVEGWNNDEESI